MTMLMTVFFGINFAEPGIQAGFKRFFGSGRATVLCYKKNSKHRINPC